MKYVTQQTGNSPAFTVAQVSYSDSSGFGALGESERRNMPVFAPRGINWVPCEGDNVLLARENGTDVCLGVISTGGLEPGELKLLSSGGAVIHLKNNGEVRINDTIIPASKGEA